MANDLVVVDAMNFRVQVLDRSGNVPLLDRQAGRRHRMDVPAQGNRLRFRRTPICRGRCLERSAGIQPARDSFCTTSARRAPDPESFSCRQGCRSTSNDRVYVVDSYNRRVQVFHYYGLAEAGRGRDAVRAFFVLTLRVAADGRLRGSSAATWRCAGHAQSDAGERSVDLRPSGSIGCTFCHAPHSGLGGVSPLWNQHTLKGDIHALHQHHLSSDRQYATAAGSDQQSCASVAMTAPSPSGQTAAYGQIQTTGKWAPGDSFGHDLSSSHPFSLVTADQGHGEPGGFVGITRQDDRSARQGEAGERQRRVHQLPRSARAGHRQDRAEFLVRDSSSGQMCLACHDPNRIMQGQINPLAGWDGSIHQTATNRLHGGPRRFLHPPLH